MAYVEKTHTWNDNWNDVIRTVIYPDEKLKELMCVPQGTSIIDFIRSYFIKDVSADEILTNEKVRVVYYDDTSYYTNNKDVHLKYKHFDIYVKDDVLYNATDDRIKPRTNLIAERIKYLLLKDTYVCNLRFNYEDDYDLWTKTVGYKRYSIVFSYKTSL